MQFRQFGRSDLRIAPLVLGGNVFGWNVDEKTSFAILDAFVDAGFNAIDTADSYSRWVPGHKGGESETIIGNWLKTQRQARQGRDRHQVRRGHGRRPQPEKGLRDPRLRGLAQAPANRPHRSLPDAFRRRNDAGRRDHAGLRAADRAGQSARGRRVQSVAAAAARRRWRPARSSACRATSPCSRFTICRTARNSRPNTRRSCARKDIGVINYYALAAGFLTGKYRSLDAALKHPGRGGRLKRYADARGFGILKALDAVAARHNATPAQVAIAWLIAQPLDHRADRQRHQPQAARRDHAGAADQADDRTTWRRSTRPAPDKGEEAPRAAHEAPPLQTTHARALMRRRPASRTRARTPRGLSPDSS